MIKLTIKSDTEFYIFFNGPLVFEGKLEDTIDALSVLGIERKESLMAISILEESGDLSAYFGTFGHFTHTCDDIQYLNIA